MPLGYDRFYNRYWHLPSMPAKICVERSTIPQDMLPGQLVAFRACEGTAAEKREAAVQVRAVITLQL